ncbi:unnamed protein product [Didymodactylos carnosus]|uniref:Uncharacterized protein n=1 Tax=Didymodactylos carnosus TaxID=1234261 RepID=A0A814WGJ0_9BILA|nr:unnamed protein product [Didymodactylos carnosus]CAF1201960.1 unnamed protein product [Didymodactylos carnosus]CAF3838501.1 unnamed protein product [Didymodactylos carnosus]CAF3966393.1 unnamed protein product [Didymodactylos carnosus]
MKSYQSPDLFLTKDDGIQNGVTLQIPITERKPCGLDWAQSSWKYWIYAAFWWWVNPILNLGNKRNLTDNDLFDLSSNDECRHLLDKLEVNCKSVENNNISTWKVIIKTFWKKSLIAGLILLLLTAAKIAQPLFLKEIVLNISDPDAHPSTGYMYAVGLGLAATFQAIIHQQFFFRIARVGMQVRIALTALIYKKVLQLKTSALLKTTSGQLINLISNDASTFEELSICLHYIWEAPLEALIVFGLIWMNIGVPTLFGYAVLILLIPLQLYFSKKFGTYRKNTLAWADKRIKTVNEILIGCQVVKMYNWEKSLENAVHKQRNEELSSVRQASRIRAINMGLFFSSLSLISLATFGGSWLMGHSLKPAQIFTVLSFFSIIRTPITNFLPTSIENLSESFISAKRISEFMSLSVHNSKTKEYILCKKPVGSIEITAASYSWEHDQPETLIDIDLTVEPGQLVGIMGSVGSSKSSLLAAILGEMNLLKGTNQISGSFAYVSQTTWIIAGTIRENILFGNQLNEAKYKQVLKACCLISDLRLLQAGDLTIIGEKGINLSGGQKARVSLARCVYAEADIYLFDDPLASVDQTVAEKIFHRCIGHQGLLQGKTRLLVTHQTQFLPEVDHCILLGISKI